VKQWPAFVLTLISFLFLTSCQKEENYDYFMQHPDVLYKAVEICQQQNHPFCADVNLASNDFSALVNERAEDPELFGQKIMQEQARAVNLLQIYQQTQQIGDVGKVKSAARAYRSQKTKIKILYAVILATSRGALRKD
jgi:hypothetical protein